MFSFLFTSLASHGNTEVQVVLVPNEFNVQSNETLEAAKERASTLDCEVFEPQPCRTQILRNIVFVSKTAFLSFYVTDKHRVCDSFNPPKQHSFYR